MRTRCGATLRWVTHDLNFLDITRPYLRHYKNRRGTFYSVSSVKKITLSYYAVYVLLESRWLDSPSTTRAIPFHSGASFAVDFIRHCERRCNAVGCPFSFSFFLFFCFFYNVHRLDRASMQMRKLDWIPGTITSNRKYPTGSRLVLYRKYIAYFRAKSGTSVFNCINRLRVRISRIPVDFPLIYIT